MLDVRLPDGNGVDVCRALRSRMPDLACLMLTSFDDEEALLDAIMAGASGYVLKLIQGGDLVAAVRTVGSGRSMPDPSDAWPTTRWVFGGAGLPGGFCCGPQQADVP